MTTTTTTYLRNTDMTAAHTINDFFEALGHGRVVKPSDVNGHITAVFIDGMLTGAAYAGVASSLADSLFLHGLDLRSIETTMRFHALEGLAVIPEHQGQGHEEVLLDSIAAHARRDFHADYLLARLDESDNELQRWFEGRDFRVCQQSQALVVDGVPTPGAVGYRDAWKLLTPHPHSTVTTTHLAHL